MWSTVRDKVRDRSKPLYAMLADATVLAVDGDTLILAHKAPMLAKRLTEQHNADVIRDALKDALGVNWRVRCEVGGAGDRVPAAEPPPPQSRPDPADIRRAEEDAMIAAARNDDTEAGPRRDPDETALELLKTELGAKPINS